MVAIRSSSRSMTPIAANNAIITTGPFMSDTNIKDYYHVLCITLCNRASPSTRSNTNN